MQLHTKLLADVAARWPPGDEETADVTAFGSPPAGVADRGLLVSLLLHAADLCTPAMAVAPSRVASQRLSLEFEAQADAELALGLPVSVLRAPDGEAKARMELSFLRFLVLPLYTLLADILPTLEFVLAPLRANTEAWERARLLDDGANRAA